MTPSEIQHLRTLLSPVQIRELASCCPSFRIPLKKILMQETQEEFFRWHNGVNTKQVARELGIPLSTAYNWLHCGLGSGSGKVHELRTAAGRR